MNPVAEFKYCDFCHYTHGKHISQIGLKGTVMCKVTTLDLKNSNEQQKQIIRKGNKHILKSDV